MPVRPRKGRHGNIHPVNESNLNARVREVLKQHARLSRDVSSLADDADLYQSGMTSHASVNVMLGLEGAFDVEFPDHMLTRNVFNTIASISTALEELKAG